MQYKIIAHTGQAEDNNLIGLFLTLIQSGAGRFTVIGHNVSGDGHDHIEFPLEGGNLCEVTVSHNSNTEEYTIEISGADSEVFSN